MAEREQIKRTPAARKQDEPAAASSGKSSEALKSEMDDLLDEIDEVLETNAEEFVKSYIQKGGE